MRALLEALRGVLSDVAEPQQVLRTILDQAVAQTGADRGVFVEVARDGSMEFRVLHRFSREDLTGPAGDYSRGVFAEVLRSGEGVLLDNALEDPRFMANESIQELRLVSVLCMPILRGGKIAALVHLENNRPGHFNEEHRGVLASLVDVAGPVLSTLRAGDAVLKERAQLKASERRARNELEENRRVLARDWSFGRFVGRAPVVRRLEETVRKVSSTDFPVLVTGETGTGKSILARVIHHAGDRSREAFATVFCPSLEKGMVETELFGHRRGAFTGAHADRVGKIAAAERGTLFLDEIADLPLEIQPKLLRLLQEKTYERVGDHRERRADVRVIAATNHDIEDSVRTGKFRRDLYERLNFIPLHVPPLRERKEDIPLLLRHFLDDSPSGRWIELSEAGEEFLRTLDFTWPGNVRHVEQLAARLTLETLDGPVPSSRLRQLLGSVGKAAGAADDGHRVPAGSDDGLNAGLPELLRKAEKDWLQRALDLHPDLTRKDLADKLKISESALFKKLRAYDLVH